MKKTYINPQTSIMVLGTTEHLLIESAHMAGGITDVTYGGKSEGGMESDAKVSHYNVWNDDWSE